MDNNNNKPARGGRGRPEMKTEEKQFDERVIHIDRVARVVKGGRRFRFRALVVIGDHKQQVGVGSAKGADVTTAVTKATEVAKKHLTKIAVYKGTLPHDAEAKISGSHILIMPASPGTGLIAGGVVRIILEVAGVHDALSKSLGSSNKTNSAYATIAALQSMVPAKNWPRNINKTATVVDKPESPKAAKTEAVDKVAPVKEPTKVVKPKAPVAKPKPATKKVVKKAKPSKEK
jgi:small subunit ribosomal protein S5